MQSVTQDSGKTVADKRLPAEVGVWLLVLVDMSVFALLFVVFLHYWNLDVEQFSLSQAVLDHSLGFINTLVLLTSSFCVVRGVHLARAEPGKGRGSSWFLSAISCGTAFGVIKILEYSSKMGEGILPDTNNFFMFYYVLTGLHLLHVLIGIGVLFLMWNQSRKGYASKGNVMFLEGGATYWHMVDLLWIIIFPLIYLIG